MARIKAARMTNATLISTVDDNTSDLESALSSILGIPLDTEITGSIFAAVNADATVQGVLKWKGAATDPVNAVGVELHDSTSGEKFRIVSYGGNLWILQYDTTDYPNAWEPLQKLNVPVTSIEQLDELTGIALKDHDGKVLKIDATDEDNVVFTPISVEAAGGVSFPGLSDVPDAIYTGNDAGDLIRINAGKNGLEAVSPTIAASDIEEMGDLNDVYPSTLAAADKGSVLAVGWDDLGGKPQYDIQVPMISAATFTAADYGGNGFRVSSAPANDPYKGIPWTGANVIDTFGTFPTAALGDAGMFSTGLSTITLPEPGIYLIEAWVKWRWFYVGPEEVDGDARSVNNVTNWLHHKIEKISANSFGLYEWRGPCQYDLNFALGASVVQQQTPDNEMEYHRVGYWYSWGNDQTIKLSVQQYSGVARYVKSATMVIAKVR